MNTQPVSSRFSPARNRWCLWVQSSTASHRLQLSWDVAVKRLSVNEESMQSASWHKLSYFRKMWGSVRTMMSAHNSDNQGTKRVLSFQKEDICNRKVGYDFVQLVSYTQRMSSMWLVHTTHCSIIRLILALQRFTCITLIFVSSVWCPNLLEGLGYPCLDWWALGCQQLIWTVLTVLSSDRKWCVGTYASVSPSLTSFFSWFCDHFIPWQFCGNDIRREQSSDEWACRPIKTKHIDRISKGSNIVVRWEYSQ